MDIKPIRTAADHRAALREIEALMMAAPGSPEADRLDLLATLVDVYEDQHFPIHFPDAVDAILFRMDQLGLSRKDLEPFIGGSSRVSEILNRKRPLTLPMIRSLHAELKIPLEALVHEYAAVPNGARGRSRRTRSAEGQASARPRGARAHPGSRDDLPLTSGGGTLAPKARRQAMQVECFVHGLAAAGKQDREVVVVPGQGLLGHLTVPASRYRDRLCRRDPS